MAKFESDEFDVATQPETLKAFLAVPANLVHILPSDRIEQWESDERGCSFKIKGLAHINIQLESSDDESVICYRSQGEKPFKFTLNVLVKPKDSGSTVSANFDADVNSFMSAMLKKPLTNFLNHLGEAIQSKFAN